MYTLGIPKTDPPPFKSRSGFFMRRNLPQSLPEFGANRPVTGRRRSIRHTKPFIHTLLSHSLSHTHSLFSPYLTIKRTHISLYITHELSLYHTRNISLLHTRSLYSTHTLPITHTLSFYTTHLLSIAHTHSLYISYTHSLYITHTLSVYHTHSLSITHTLSQLHSLLTKLTLSFNHTHSLFPSYTLSFYLTHTLFPSHPHSLSLSNTLTLNTFFDIHMYLHSRIVTMISPHETSHKMGS